MDISTHPCVKPIQDTDQLSVASKSQYLRQLQKVMNVTKAPSLEHVIKNPESVVKTIDMLQFSPSLKKSMVSSVCALFKYNENLRIKYPKERETWSNLLRGINRTELDRVASAEPTPRETLNWVDWKTISAKERELAATEYASDRHMLLALYVLMEPVRSDYGNVHVCVDETPGRDLDRRGENYILLSSVPGGSYLVLNKYKTAVKYGRYHRPVPDELVRIIARNLERLPREYLIIDTAGEPYTNPGSFNKYVNRTLAELFGKRVTINLLRHSFVSGLDFNRKTPKDLMTISKNMMHSIGMQQLYRRHVDPMQVTLAESVATDPVRTEGERKKKKKKKRNKDKQHQTLQTPVTAPNDGRVVIV
jgi:hypothetical protein